MITNNDNGYPYKHNNPQNIDLSTVENYTLADYGLTFDAVKSNHFGIRVTDPRTGEHLPAAFCNAKIESAVGTVEKMLDMIILPRVITEHHDFYSNDFESFMYIRTHHRPILQVEEVKLEYGRSMVFKYPTS